MRLFAVAAFGGMAVLTIAATPAHALEMITGHVTMLEAIYMPDRFVMQMDAGNSSCPANSLLIWNKQPADNVKAAYAAALAAVTSGKMINFFINDGDKNCIGQFLHITINQ